MSISDNIALLLKVTLFNGTIILYKHQYCININK